MKNTIGLSFALAACALCFWGCQATDGTPTVPAYTEANAKQTALSASETSQENQHTIAPSSQPADTNQSSLALSDVIIVKSPDPDATQPVFITPPPPYQGEGYWIHDNIDNAATAGMEQAKQAAVTWLKGQEKQPSDQIIYLYAFQKLDDGSTVMSGALGNNGDEGSFLVRIKDNQVISHAMADNSTWFNVTPLTGLNQSMIAVTGNAKTLGLLSQTQGKVTEWKLQLMMEDGHSVNTPLSMEGQGFIAIAPSASLPVQWMVQDQQGKPISQGSIRPSTSNADAQINQPQPGFSRYIPEITQEDEALAKSMPQLNLSAGAQQHAMPQVVAYDVQIGNQKSTRTNPLQTSSFYKMFDQGIQIVMNMDENLNWQIISNELGSPKKVEAFVSQGAVEAPVKVTSNQIMVPQNIGCYALRIQATFSGGSTVDWIAKVYRIQK